VEYTLAHCPIFWDHLKHRLNGKNTDQEDFLQKRETLELVRAYYQIPDTLVRKRLFETIKALAKSTALKA